MLQTAFPAPFLEPNDIALLSRVLDKLHLPGDTLMDREAKTATLLHLFQSGTCEKKS